MLGWRNCWRISASRSNRSRILPPWASSPLMTLTAAGAPGRLVGPAIDDAHGAGAEDRLDPERTELFADQTPGVWLMIASTPCDQRADACRVGAERRDHRSRDPIASWLDRRRIGRSRSGHRARDAAGGGQVAVLDVVHHHPVGVEPPGQRPEGVLLAGDPAAGQARGVARVVERDDLVGQRLDQRLVVALVLDRRDRMGLADADGEPVGAVIRLGPPAVEDREVQAAVEQRPSRPRCRWPPAAGAGC